MRELPSWKIVSRKAHPISDDEGTLLNLCSLMIAPPSQENLSSATSAMLGLS